MKFHLQKSFLIGLAAGAGLAILAIQGWGTYLTHVEAENAQPVILRPLHRLNPGTANIVLGPLREPWFPDVETHLDGNWKIRALEGGEKALPDFKGNVVFLSYWNTTCGPCIQEMPGISKLAESLSGEPIQFAAVTEEEPSLVKNFVKENKFNIPIYTTTQAAPTNLPVQGWPTTYIIDKAGLILFKHVGALNWDSESSRKYLRSLAEKP